MNAARRLLLCAALTACGGTEVADPPPAAEPAGWIYFRPADDMYAAPARIDTESGAIEYLELRPPFQPKPSYYYESGFVSSMTGDLSGKARFGGLFPETFVLDAKSGEVTIYRDVTGPFTISVDARHVRAPDGGAIAFERHQTSGCCSVWVLLHPSTGILDTLEAVANQVPYEFGWFGADTLLWWRTDAQFRSYALATGVSADWNLVPFNNFKIPTTSLNRQWIAYWSLADSTVAGKGTVQFVKLHLFDRQRGTDTLLLTAPNQGDVVVTSLSESFDPDSRFLAYCTTFTNIRILELATGRVAKNLTVPHCYALTWSWGPEGRPARLGN
ncbi:MAG: hypothetical protein H0W15_09640 [Gemmatimonadales bacterium]|nr:hypothetical protein [Gemmatimonadales bacterium]